ncbi:mRNA splicing protein sme1 [Saitoella coloradoensis]
MSGRKQRVMVPPINLIFKFLQQRTTVQIWLYEQTETRMEGQIRGFDEFMNIVVDDAAEVNQKTNARRELGRILLKGDNITLIRPLNVQ